MNENRPQRQAILAAITRTSKALWLLPLLVLAGAGVTKAEDLVWENDTARLVLTNKGEFRALVDKSTNKEHYPTKAAPFMTVLKDGQKWQATSAVKNGDTVGFTFGASGIEARLRVTTQPLYFLVELVNVEPAAEAAEVEFANVPAAIEEHVGAVVNAVWNDAFVVCVMGLSPNVEGHSCAASVYRQFGMSPARATILALPPQRFYEAVQRMEQDCGLPSPTLGGQWAKTSEDVRRGYLFIDLTEGNVDEVIRWAKLGAFGYILIYAPTWATTRGSYPMNSANYPSGEAGLKAVANKCHAAGLKVGIHCLTSFVAKSDPLVTPRPDPRLLKDRFATLAMDITESASTIPATDSVADWPALPSVSFVPDRGLDVQIDDELIGYTVAGGPDGKTFLQCKRGLHGTRKASHKRGAQIAHLAQRYAHYFVDLRTSLKDELADRLAGVVNRCGLDMIYFDGAESNSIMGPERWYWVTAAQQAVWQRLQREVLVEGAGRTHWTWHFYARGVCGDFASLSPKTYLDYTKLPMWKSYRDNFLPAHLGWWGLVDHGPDHPATLPDEVEMHAVRMLALDSPIAMETRLAELKENARAEEMVRLLGQYERVRLARKVPPTVRDRLKQGEWRVELREGDPAFRPVSYETLRLDGPGAVTLQNRFGPQPLAFRLRAEPRLTNTGDAANRVLFRPPTPLSVEPPAAATFKVGALANRVEFARAAGDQAEPDLVGPVQSLGSGRLKGSAPDLTAHRALAVRLEVDSPISLAGGPSPVLNVQLESASRMYRDHHIDLNFRGEKTVVLPGPTADRTLPELSPPPSTYLSKHAMMVFDYGKVSALNFRWMRAPKQRTLRVRIHSVEALRESEAQVRNLAITAGDATLSLPIALRTTDYAEFSGTGEVRVFDANGRLRVGPVKPLGQLPVLQPGANPIELRADEYSPMTLTVITMGDPLRP